MLVILTSLASNLSTYDQLVHHMVGVSDSVSVVGIFIAIVALCVVACCVHKFNDGFKYIGISLVAIVIAFCVLLCCQSDSFINNALLGNDKIQLSEVTQQIRNQSIAKKTIVANRWTQIDGTHFVVNGHHYVVKNSMQVKKVHVPQSQAKIKVKTISLSPEAKKLGQLGDVKNAVVNGTDYLNQWHSNYWNRCLNQRSWNGYVQARTYVTIYD